jgi:hypothetical protein
MLGKGMWLFISGCFLFTAIGLAAIPINISGRVVNSSDEEIGLNNVFVELPDLWLANTRTDEAGYFTLQDVDVDSTSYYLARFVRQGFYSEYEYFPASAQDIDLGIITLDEIQQSPRLVRAVRQDSSNYCISWSGPYLGDHLLHYGNSYPDGYFYTTPYAAYAAAVRFPPEELTGFHGCTLEYVNVYIGSTICTYGITVWKGGDENSTGIAVSGQDYQYFEDTGWQEIPIYPPVLITGDEEIRIGVFVGGEHFNPMYFNSGPLLNWQGNLYYNGEWTTLYDEFGDVSGNWCIQGLVNIGARDAAPAPVLLSLPPRILPDVKLQIVSEPANERSFQGYKVWRLAEGQEEIPALWQLLTPEPIFEQRIYDTWTHQDFGHWSVKWAIEAVYTGANSSPPAFSNVFSGGTAQGQLCGTVRNLATNAIITGAAIVFNPGNYYTFSDNTCYYSYLLPPGIYSIFTAVSGYDIFTLQGISVTNGNVTTVNINLTPPSAADENSNTPLVTGLSGCYPNPVIGESRITYSIKDASVVQLSLYNCRGQCVCRLVDEVKTGGSHTAVWDRKDDYGSRVSPGMYFIRMKAGGLVLTKRVVVIR